MYLTATPDNQFNTQKEGIKMKHTEKCSIGANRNQSGFTIIEVLVVLIVGLGILAMSSGKIEMLFSGSDLGEEASNINTLIPNIRSLKSSSGYGAAGTDLTTQLVGIDGIPKNVTILTNVMYNNWNGAIVPASTGTGYTITDNSIPMPACIKLATKTSKSGAFASIKINANAAIVGEVTSATATTQCNSATANVLVFTSNS